MRHRSYDTTPVAVGAAAGGAAAIGVVAVVSTAVGGIIGAYFNHVRGGGKHLPEILLVPFVILAWVVFALTVIYAQDATSLLPVTAHGMGSWIGTAITVFLWFGVFGALLGSNFLAGEGIVFDAVVPLIALWLAHTQWQVTGWGLFLIWACVRAILAAMDRLPRWRRVRKGGMGLLGIAALLLPAIISWHWLGHDTTMWIAAMKIPKLI